MSDRTCAAEGCDLLRWARKDYCRKHQERLNRNGTLTKRTPGPVPQNRRCSVEGCTGVHKAFGYCRKHLDRERAVGRLLDGDGCVCAFAGCGRPVSGHGLCQGHRKQRQQGKPLAPLRERRSRDGICPGPQCDLPIRGGGYCGGHYYQHSRELPLTPIDRSSAVPKGTPCVVDGCGRPSLTKDGICRTHYRYRTGGDEDWQRPIPGRAVDGEGHLNEHGYRIMCIDGVMVPEHRLVMERLIGRPLLPSETVHHKTGGFKGRADNRPGNLELWTGRHPTGHRVEDVVTYCREMLAVYGTEAERALFAEHAAAVAVDCRTGGFRDG